jgi:hypothetical protein
MWLWTSKVVILNVQNDEIGFKTNLQKGGFFSSKLCNCNVCLFDGI